MSQARLTKHRESRSDQLKRLVAEQEVELANPLRDGYKHSGRVRAANLSLDATLGDSESFTILDTIGSEWDSPVEDAIVSETTESLLDWLTDQGVDLGDLADRCLEDRDLAAALAESTELGYPTELVRVALMAVAS